MQLTGDLFSCLLLEACLPPAYMLFSVREARFSLKKDSVKSKPLKYLMPFPTTHLCAQKFPQLFYIKSKYKNCTNTGLDLCSKLSTNGPEIQKTVSTKHTDDLIKQANSVMQLSLYCILSYMCILFGSEMWNNGLIVSLINNTVKMESSTS
jgi:hypothetical protein